MRFPKITLRQFESLISTKAVTVPQLASYCRAIAVAGEEVWKLNAFASLLPETTIQKQAKQSQDRWDSGKPLSPLDGVPISIKGNLAVETQPLTAGSALLGEGTETPPVGYTADTVRSLQSMGAIIIGITRMDEFGMGSLGTNVPSGAATKNPLSFLPRNESSTSQGAKESLEDIASIIQSTTPQQIRDVHEQLVASALAPVSAGGSSCGGAASVAHGSSLLALGSDTGGSVRLPSAWCGLVGIRPTYDRLSRHGLVSYASSFDTVGVLANSSDCIGMALQSMAEYNDSSRDSTLSSKLTKMVWPISSSSIERPFWEARVGIPEAFSVTECPTEVKEAWLRSADALSQAGATVDVIPDSQISSELLHRSLAAYFILVTAEASSNLARYDGFRYGVSVPKAADSWNRESSPFSLLEHQYAAACTRGFGPEVIRRILCGTAALSSDRFHTHYEGAARLRADLTAQLHSSLQDYNMLLVPTVCFAPPLLSEAVDPVEAFANDVMTVPASLAGLPALSVPVGRTSDGSGRPMSLQLIGRSFDEPAMLQAASVLESTSVETSGSAKSVFQMPSATWSIASLELAKQHPPVDKETLETFAKRALLDLTQLDNVETLQSEVGNMMYMMNQIHMSAPTESPSQEDVDLEIEVRRMYDTPRNVEATPLRSVEKRESDEAPVAAFPHVWESLLSPKTQRVGGFSFFVIETERTEK